MPTTSKSVVHQRESLIVPAVETQVFTLWIDGVGAWLLCVGEQFLVGAQNQQESEADISLLANLSRRHATISRNGEEWFIRGHQETVVSGKEISDRSILRTGDQITLGKRVRLGFRQPSPLCTSAVIDFESGHRPARSVDGVVLLSDHCLLGPGADTHIRCPDWPGMVVLFRQGNSLRCRSRVPLFEDGKPIRESAEITDGVIISGENFRFHAERRIRESPRV